MNLGGRFFLSCDCLASLGCLALFVARFLVFFTAKILVGHDVLAVLVVCHVTVIIVVLIIIGFALAADLDY